MFIMRKRYTYNSEYKQTECFNCQKGYFSILEGSIQCSQCPLGTFNSLIKSTNCEKCDYGYYNDELGSEECKLCPINYYSDEKGSTFCKKCEDNKYSLLGFSKCIYCEEIIPNCNICTKDKICLECNNNAKSGYNNCTICENEVDWKFNGEYCELITICSKYFYINKNDNNKINCINDITECPEDINYLNLDTRECKNDVSTNDLIKYQYKLKGGEEALNKVSNEKIFKEKTFDDALIDFLNKNRVTIKGINSNLQIGYEENLKKYYKDNIGINLGNCLDIIRLKYGIKKGTNIVYKVIDVNFNGTRYVNYSLYNTEDLHTPLNLTPCENQTVTIINPPINLSIYKNILEEYYYQVLEKIKDGIDIYTIYDKLYKDYPCFAFDSFNKYELTLKDRRNFITDNNITLCEDQCSYEGENLTQFQLICYCPIKTEMNKNISFNSLKEGFLDVHHKNNFIVLKCYKLAFSSEGLKSNYLFYIFIIFLFLNITFIIIMFLCSNYQIDKLIKKCILFIYNNNYNDINDYNIKFKKLRDKYLKHEYDGDYEKYKKEEILGLRETHRSIKNNKKSENEYYFYLIYIYPINERKKFLIDDEINDLEYYAYRKIDNRNCFQIYFSIFKSDYNFIKIFSFLKEDYKIYTIEIMIYLNSLIISIIFNIAFFTNKSMHKIYDNERNYNFINSLPEIFISNISFEIIFFIFEMIIDFQDKLIDLKKDLQTSEFESNVNQANIRIYRKMENINIISNTNRNLENNQNIERIKSSQYSRTSKDKKAESIKKKFRCWCIVFYLLILIINIFGWYFGTCFSAVYKNTQIFLFYNFLFSIPFNIINCAFISFLKLIIIQLPRRNCNCMKHIDHKVIKFIIKSFLFIIGMILEYLIFNYFIN